MRYHLHVCNKSAVVAGALVIGLFISSFAAKTWGQDWQRFTSSKGGFSVLMPGKPTYYHKAKHTKLGDVGEEFYSYKNDKMTLTVEYSDIPTLAAIFGGHNTIYDRANEVLNKVGTSCCCS